MAEVIAQDIRDSILRGELAVLPRLEDLVARYGAGPPAVREAMRILETEGLITIRRGNVGGADVHLPDENQLAYTAALVLQSIATEVSDVGAALRAHEPKCAGLCAARPDRQKTVVPQLRAIVAEQAAAIDDPPRTVAITDRFHAALVDGCGNNTLALVVGALERLWVAHATDLFSGEAVREASPETMKASLKEHDRLLGAIERGDPKVVDMARKHLEATQSFISQVADSKLLTATSNVLHQLG